MMTANVANVFQSILFFRQIKTSMLLISYMTSMLSPEMGKLLPLIRSIEWVEISAESDPLLAVLGL